MGFSLSLKLGADQQPASMYQIEVIESLRNQVPVHSTLHYRDLATKNYARDEEVSFSKEIEQCAIYFGVNGATRSLLIVTRPNEGEIALMIRNPKVRKALETFEHVVAKLLKQPLIDENNSLNQSIEFYTISKDDHALTGYLTKKSFFRSIRMNPVESGLACLSIVLFCISFGLDQILPAVPIQGSPAVDPTPAFVRRFASISHFFVVSFCTSSLTVTIKHLMAKGTFVRWPKTSKS